MTEASTKQLSNEDRMILAETFAARAEQHLAPRAEPDFAAAVEEARHLCEALRVEVRPAPNAFTLAGERLRDARRVAVGQDHALALPRSTSADARWRVPSAVRERLG